MAKKATVAFLTGGNGYGNVAGRQIQNVMAADDSPYVISTGRMVYASSSVGNSNPAYAVDGSTGTRWESAWNDNTEWIYVDLGKVTDVTGVKLYWEGAYAKKYKIQVSNDEENLE